MPTTAKKPYVDFPLFPHQNGQWAKKIKGKLHYFGCDPDKALEKYLDERDELQAGRTPSRPSGVTVKYLVERYLDICKLRNQLKGKPTLRTLADYHAIGKLIGKHLRERGEEPGSLEVAKLQPTHFTSFYFDGVAHYSPSRRSKIINVTRSIFNYALEEKLIPELPAFGANFKIDDKETFRKHRKGQPKKLLIPKEIHALLDASDPKWKAIILLGINCAFGNSDISRIKLSDVGGKWIDLPRGKTGIDRRIPLWKETQDSIQEAIAERPQTTTDLLFVSSHGGPMVVVHETSTTDLIAEGFRRLAEAAGIHRTSMGFYWLRHTFQTIGDKSKDRLATSSVMGHADNSMSAEYNEEFDDSRLVDVVTFVHDWLYAKDDAELIESDMIESDLIEKLPPDVREICNSHIVDGVSLRTLAEQHGLSIKELRDRVKDALKQLREATA